MTNIAILILCTSYLKWNSGPPKFEELFADAVPFQSLFSRYTLIHQRFIVNWLLLSICYTWIETILPHSAVTVFWWLNYGFVYRQCFIYKWSVFVKTHLSISCDSCFCLPRRLYWVYLLFYQKASFILLFAWHPFINTISISFAFVL